MPHAPSPFLPLFFFVFIFVFVFFFCLVRRLFLLRLLLGSFFASFLPSFLSLSRVQPSLPLSRCLPTFFSLARFCLFSGLYIHSLGPRGISAAFLVQCSNRYQHSSESTSLPRSPRCPFYRWFSMRGRTTDIGRLITYLRGVSIDHNDEQRRTTTCIYMYICTRTAVRTEGGL